MEIWQTSSVVKYISLHFTTLLCAITNTAFGLGEAGRAAACSLCRGDEHLIVFTFMLPAKGDNVATILCLHISRFCI